MDASGSRARTQATDRTLWLLSVVNFAIGMGAFVVIGIITPVAQDLRVTPAEAGRLLTIYALVYAISSPLLVALSGRIDRVIVLAGGMGVFALGALACALSNDLNTVLWARALMALGGGLVTPVAASIGVALAGQQDRGRALSIVFTGLTLAQAVGVPCGAWLGYAFGWRVAFGVVTALCALAVLACLLRLPRGIQVPVATLASLGAVLKSWRETLAVLFTALFICALYVVYTFMSPFMETRFGLGRDGVTLALALFGAGAVVGNAVGGRLSDRIGPQRTLQLLCLSQLVLLPLITLVPIPLVVFIALLFLWSVCGWSFMVPQQARLASLAPERVPVLFALNAAAIYMGGSMGSALGGAALTAAGFSVLGPVAAGVALLALWSLRAYRCPQVTR